MVPPAPRAGAVLKINYNPFTASWRLINATMHIPRLFMAICAISFFWTIGAVLIIIFPPLVKNVLTPIPRVSSMVIALFSIGIAIGSVVINTMLKGKVSAKYAPASVIAMGAMVVVFSLLVRAWPEAPDGTLYNMVSFFQLPRAIPVVLVLMAIAITGGMFVVPLYTFLTTTVTKDQTARTVAANNVVNSGAMVVGALMVQARIGAGRDAGEHAVPGRGHVPDLRLAGAEAASGLRLGESVRRNSLLPTTEQGIIREFCFSARLRRALYRIFFYI